MPTSATPRGRTPGHVNSGFRRNDGAWMDAVGTDCRSFARGLAVALGVFASSAAGAAGGNVWSYVDADGVTHFSNVPDRASPYRLYLKDPDSYRLKGARSSASAVPGRSSSKLAATSLDKLPYADLIASAATAHRIDAALLHAVIHIESRHNPAAVSPKGAIGLMQVLPETARRMGVKDPEPPEQNIAAGARYLRFLLDTFGNDTQLALAAYNAGENAVIRNGNQIPPYPETRAYVPAVLEAYQALRTSRPATKPSAKS